jgi:hypothetical protein
VFIASAVVLAMLAGVVLLSAGVRLGLYQAAYGWTELRFYALAAIVWIAACLAAAVILLPRQHAHWLPHVAAMLAVVVAIAVNIADPQAFVASQNVDRALHPERIAAGGTSGLDADYLATLGDDAVPTLVAALPALSTADAEPVRGALRARHTALGIASSRQGWPSWDLARTRALDLLRDTFGQEPASP